MLLTASKGNSMKSFFCTLIIALGISFVFVHFAFAEGTAPRTTFKPPFDLSADSKPNFRNECEEKCYDKYVRCMHSHMGGVYCTKVWEECIPGCDLN